VPIQLLVCPAADNGIRQVPASKVASSDVGRNDSRCAPLPNGASDAILMI
jgi:hypothetical protein